jgi:2,4-dienoyl-CoA reductase-like NADH-dependent reductase (Old Yellow Enzyme family)
LKSIELFSPLRLRSGGTLRNRIAKAAMEENLAGSSQLPDGRLISLYRRWGAGGAGLLRVIAMLEPLGVDLVELSGGSYESPAMAGRPTDGRSAAREAYFLELAAELAKTSRLPLMLTGGISSRETAEQVLASGVELVGMATAIAVTPDLPIRWREGREASDQPQLLATTELETR